MTCLELIRQAQFVKHSLRLRSECRVDAVRLPDREPVPAEYLPCLYIRVVASEIIFSRGMLEVMLSSIPAFLLPASMIQATQSFLAKTRLDFRLKSRLRTEIRHPRRTRISIALASICG